MKRNLIFISKYFILIAVSELDPFELLYPFLEIIRSGETTGPITGAALSSVEKFIKYEIISNFKFIYIDYIYIINIYILK